MWWQYQSLELINSPITSLLKLNLPMQVFLYFLKRKIDTYAHFGAHMEIKQL